MKRTTGLALSLALFLSACIPAIPFPQLASATPTTVDVQATNAALTAAAENAATVAPPTATIVFASDTPQATTTLSGTDIAETQNSGTQTAVQGTVESISSLSVENLTETAIAGITATLTPSGPVATETLYARFFGTLPPAIPYGKIVLSNKSQVEVYISMQCTTPEGYKTILEYPVKKSMTVSAPIGKYTYVVWVGGRQLQGYFGLGKQDELTITIFKDRVRIKK